jgi:hypothetical protein
VVETAEALFQNGRQDLAVKYLNFYSGARATEALRLGQDRRQGSKPRVPIRHRRLNA